MRCQGARAMLLALLMLMLTLATLAHASPPDQTWLHGIYDDADFDDVIVLITSLKGAPPDDAVTVSRPGLLVSTLVVPSGPGELPPLG